MHKSLRIYNNGDMVRQLINPEDIKNHIEYNRVYRPGCMLIIDGAVTQSGYISKEREAEYIQKFDTLEFPKEAILPYR